MLFNSVEFLIFLPVTLILYFVFPKKYRHIVLLIASYIFYIFWNYLLIFLILFTTGIAYGAGILIPKIKNPKGRKALMICSVLLILSALVFFKYTNFILSSINAVSSWFNNPANIDLLDIILPVGISFYTFQTLSYVIDVYQNKYEPEKNFLFFALYVSFFPQLVAGPIERPENLLPQLKNQEGPNPQNIKEGLKWMLVGFVKKIAIADMLGVFVSRVYNNIAASNGALILIATLLFAVQILCDFGGYSDIAIGVAKLFNIDLMKNFDHPYRATSIKDFWCRWHISLSTWLRDYIYYPMGGSRVSKFKWCINILVVFLVSGIWHGAAWTYVIWGLMHGILRIIDGFLLPVIEKKERPTVINVLRMIGTFLLVSFTWIAFRANSISDMAIAYRNLFANWSFSSEYWLNVYTTLDLSLKNILIISFVIVLFEIIHLVLTDGFELKVNKFVRYGIYIVLLWIVIGCFIYSSSSGVESSFIYFQF